MPVPIFINQQEGDKIGEVELEGWKNESVLKAIEEEKDICSESKEKTVIEAQT